MQHAQTASVLAAVLFGLCGCGGGYSQSSQPAPNPAPTPSFGPVSITAISPTSAVAGSPDLTLSLTGTSMDLLHAGQALYTHTFVSWCSAVGNCTNLAASVASATELTAEIPAALMAKPDAIRISVQKWYFADDTPFAVSNSVDFAVTEVAAPSQAVSPSSETLGTKGSRQFEFKQDGSVAAASWEIQEGIDGGQISSTGLYTAPDHTGTFHIIASAAEGAAESATATVIVVASGFTATGSMHVARSGHTATLLSDGRVLIIGGDEHGRAEIFDPSNGSFSFTGNLTTARFGATATLLVNGKVLVAGGFSTQTEPGTGMLVRLSSSEIFDPASGVFSPAQSMNTPRVLHTATLLEDGRVLIAGGTDTSIGGGMATAMAEVYDPGGGTFKVVSSMISARAKHTSTSLPTGEVLIAGGSNGAAADAADDPPWDPLFAELFSPLSNTFQTSASMSTTRIGHKAVRLSDGKVLVLGGIPLLQNIHVQLSPAYGEIFDPVPDSFAQMPNFFLSQSGYSATTLKGGPVLIVGGGEKDTVTAKALLLDAGSGTLQQTGSLSMLRTQHTATLLHDGRVLVTGGFDARGTALASAEIYQ
jgi:hypothetical protein